jgi:hypothetical protein
VTENFDQAVAWNHFYLWGVTSKLPAEIELQTQQLQALLGAIGAEASISSLAALEPRYLINPKGTTPWTMLFVYAFMNDKDALAAVAQGKAAVCMPAQGMLATFNSHVAWPQSVLDKYPFDFGKHTAFIIPFIRFGTAPVPRPLPQSLKSPDGSIEIMGVAEFNEQRPEALLALFHQFHAQYGKQYA